MPCQMDIQFEQGSILTIHLSNLNTAVLHSSTKPSSKTDSHPSTYRPLESATIVLNSQSSAKQLWLSLPLSGPFKFDLHPSKIKDSTQAAEEFKWLSTKDPSLDLDSVLFSEIDLLMGKSTKA